jgi:hypothetical protein
MLPCFDFVQNITNEQASQKILTAIKLSLLCSPVAEGIVVGNLRTVVKRAFALRFFRIYVTNGSAM